MKWVLLVIVVAALIVLIAFIAAANRFRRTGVMIREALKDVDIALVKRYDTISEMARAAKSYAQHEEETFVGLSKVRSGASIQEMNDIARRQDDVLARIRAVGEAYPELGSSAQYLELEKQIAEENDQLAAAKRVVNGNVSAYNKMVVSFPTSVVAGSHGWSEQPFFDETDVERKKDLDDISFGGDAE